MKALTLFWICVMCACCSINTPKSNVIRQKNENSVFNLYVLDSLKILLNRDINEIKNLKFPQDVSLKDTILESEGDNWNGIAFYKKTQLLLVLETSWIDKNHIKRIGVISNTIVGSNNMKIGAKFGEIKSNLSQKIPSFPDGYLGLRDNHDQHVTYFFNVGTNTDLITGNIKFETMPDTLVVNEILIE